MKKYPNNKRQIVFLDIMKRFDNSNAESHEDYPTVPVTLEQARLIMRYSDYLWLMYNNDVIIDYPHNPDIDIPIDVVADFQDNPELAFAGLVGKNVEPQSTYELADGFFGDSHPTLPILIFGRIPPGLILETI